MFSLHSYSWVSWCRTVGTGFYSTHQWTRLLLAEVCTGVEWIAMPQRQPTQGLVGPRLAALASGGNIPSPPARHGELVLIADAQREIRQGYMGGFMGQLVSGVLFH